MTLSIIIVSFNTKKYTLKCIKSIKKAAPKLTYEIIVVDNASTDESVSALKKQKVKLIANKKNIGFASANNKGIKIAKGKYILLLNSDTEIKKKALEKLINFAEKTPEAGVVVPKLLNSNGTTQASVYKNQSIPNAIKQYWLGKKGTFDKYAPLSSNPSEVNATVAAAFLITPKAQKKVGLFNEKYFMYYEDLDYCRRVRSANLKVYYFPEAKITHHHGKSGENVAPEAAQWKRLVPSSKMYHGVVKHYALNYVIWSGQKLSKITGLK